MDHNFLDKAREDYELIKNCYNKLLKIVTENEALEKDECIRRKLAKLKKSLARFDTAIKSYEEGDQM